MIKRVAIGFLASAFGFGIAISRFGYKFDPSHAFLIAVLVLLLAWTDMQKPQSN